VLVASAGCGSSPAPSPDARAVLQQAKQAIDSATAVHFSLTSTGAASASGTAISAADGDAHRPDGFSGTLTVLQSGFTVKVHIVSARGTFYVQLPFTSRFEPTDPGKYGFGDPATLLDPDKGLSSLLVEALSARLGDRDRLQGEELEEVEVTLPGQRVRDLLTSADPSQAVTGRIGIAVDTHQIRRVVLTGPFFDAHTKSTYTLVLDRYGENVSITPPA
jgi:LppX_LprAFG lipoprotein